MRVRVPIGDIQTAVRKTEVTNAFQQCQKVLKTVYFQAQTVFFSVFPIFNFTHVR